jgi:UDP-glucose 4-epimerase
MGKISLNNKKVLVTGGNGYLGSFLVDALKKENAKVSILSLNTNPENNEYEADITDFETLNKVIQEIKPEIVFHLAASISRDRDFSIYDKMEKTNVKGTLNLLQSLQDLDTHFIFTSTSEVYGNNSSPFREDQVPMPVSPYSLTKINAENLIKTFCSNHNKNFTNLRLFNFYGKNMSEAFFIPQMINSLKRGEDFLMTKGEQKRDFLYIDDVIEALLLTAKDTESYSETFNVCSGIGTQLSSLSEAINAELNTPDAKVKVGAIPYRDNEVWEMIGDNSKIHQKLGFTPKTNIVEGIKKVIYNS